MSLSHPRIDDMPYDLPFVKDFKNSIDRASMHRPVDLIIQHFGLSDGGNAILPVLTTGRTSASRWNRVPLNTSKVSVCSVVFLIRVRNY